MSPFEETDDVTCKETNDVTGHDRGWSLNLFVGCSIDDVRQCGRPSESNCCLLRARDAGSSYVGIEASGLPLASHRRFCPQFPASSHENKRHNFGERGGNEEERGEAIFASCLSSCSSMGKRNAHNYQPLPSSASLGLKERCLARCLTVSGSHRRIRSSNA